VASAIWIGGVAAYVAPQVADKDFRPEDARFVALYTGIAAIGPPLVLFLLGGGWLWIAGGFRRRPGDADGPVAGTPTLPRWSWSTPETEALYRHLNDGWHALVVEAARPVVMPEAGDAPQRWDRSLAAHRRFERALRSAVEDRCDAFFLDGVTDHDAGTVCRDVGSLWRVHWEELAGRLLAELGNVPTRAAPAAPAPANDIAPERKSETAAPAAAGSA
jgi:hypothetical protein